MKVKGFTIDGSRSRDLDDAIWVERRKDGGWLIQVHVSDVAGAVPRAHEFDARARERLETKYRPSFNVPMLPRFLSENKLSLLPGRKRSVVTTEVVLDASLSVVETKVYLATLRSLGRLAFEEIPGVLADPGDEAHGRITLAAALAQGLLEQRRAAGAFALYDLNDGWVSTEEGFLLRLDRAVANIGYIIIQELMILANTRMAAWAAERDVPVLFRNHTAKGIAPDREALIQQILQAQALPETIMSLRARTHMVLNKATYDGRLLGHFGLNLPAYVHSTSPIRRYADLVVQRQVRARLRDEALPYTQAELDELGPAITQTLNERKDRTSEHLKGQAEETAGQRIEVMGAGQLLGLKPKEFERVVKVAARSGTFSEELAEAVLRKAKSGTLSNLDLFVLLYQTTDHESWPDLREALIDYLVEHPHHAPSVCGIGMGIAGWSALSFDENRTGPDHAPRFQVVATVTIGGVGRRSKPVGAGSAKAARQQATVGLLAALAGCTEPEEPQPEPEAPVVIEALPAASDNPIAALQEEAQKHRHGAPAYHFNRVGGADHAPEFACTVTYRGSTATSSRTANKKLAKREAAALMLAKLGVNDLGI